jgi:hypothetical protein
MAELKGGTTGQVLSKTSGTDMDFTWVAPSTTATSLGYAAGKNKIINGDFGIWQRGTSFTPAINTYVYCADRFRVIRDGLGTVTVSQQTFTPGTAPVAGYEGTYFFRYNQTVAGTLGTYSTIEQPIEDVRTYAGQTVTISFWAKADSARTFTPQFIQGFGTGGSSRVDTNGTAITVTTSWVRYTQTFSIPSVSGKTIGANNNLIFVLNLALNTTQTLDFWGFQIEAGSTATAFQTASGSVAGELALCQRYYYRFGGDQTTQPYGIGYGTSGTTALITVTHPVPMRIAPSLTDYALLWVVDHATTTNVTSMGVPGNWSGKNCTAINAVVASGLTTNRPYNLIAQGSLASYLGFSAEF